MENENRPQLVGINDSIKVGIANYENLYDDEYRYVSEYELVIPIGNYTASPLILPFQFDTQRQYAILDGLQISSGNLFNLLNENYLGDLTVNDKRIIFASNGRFPLVSLVAGIEANPNDRYLSINKIAANSVVKGTYRVEANVLTAYKANILCRYRGVSKK